jgi:hypothetical protein
LGHAQQAGCVGGQSEERAENAGTCDMECMQLSMALSHNVLEQSCSKHQSPVRTRSVIPSSADSDASAISGVCVYACTPVLDGSCMPVFVQMLFTFVLLVRSVPSCLFMDKSG